MRLIDFFDRGVALHPGRSCLKDANRSRTFRDVQMRSYRIANALIAAGFRLGQIAAVYSPNDAVAFECIPGIVRAGTVWVPIYAKNAVAENTYIAFERR